LYLPVNSRVARVAIYHAIFKNLPRYAGWPSRDRQKYRE
jgi:hypothetical protein